jgi:ABC-type transporter Mla subunit MlaD
MNTTQSSYSTRFKVGIFTILGLLLIVAFSIVVNDRPYWWRPCQLVKINIEDATGLKTKSPIRSLGIEIGFLKSVMLSETHVTLGICITAPVEVLPSTRAYIRGEGFLGDKFVELKPVKYLGGAPNGQPSNDEGHLVLPKKTRNVSRFSAGRLFRFAWAAIGPREVWAATAAVPPASTEDSSGAAKGIRRPAKGSREIPVGEESQDIQHLVNRVDELVHQMTGLTDNIKQSINPEDLRRTMRQLNQTLENASKTLAPEGGLNQTAQRTLAKLEDAIEQLRNIMTRISKGEGPIGTLVADQQFAEEMKNAIRNVNRLLNKVGDVQFVVDIGGVNLTGINGGRGWFQLGIWPRPDHYYLVGIAGDSRGRISNSTVTTTAGGITQVTQTQVVEQTGLLITAMVGKVYWNRFDVSLGALYGDGAASLMLNLGPFGAENRIQLRNDIYVRNAVGSFDDRATLILKPIENISLRVGFDSVRGVFGSGTPGGADFIYGANVTFTDNDIKLIFAFL